jgi:hypothetical protein
VTLKLAISEQLSFVVGRATGWFKNSAEFGEIQGIQPDPNSQFGPVFIEITEKLIKFYHKIWILSGLNFGGSPNI